MQLFSVPGAFEIPQAARAAAETGRFDAIVCLGCIIRGETPHFDYIASAVAHGITDAAGETGVPMAFGVLTTDTVEQATARSGPGPDNKGREAAAAAIEMAALYKSLAGAIEPPVRVPRMSADRRRVPRGIARAKPRCRCSTSGKSAASRRTKRSGPTGRDATRRRRKTTSMPTRCRRPWSTSVGRTFANGLVAGTIARVAETDELIAAHLKNWRIERIAVIDRLIMRLAIYELLTEPDTPAKVIINEALELARTFSGEEPVPFINGVLDAVRKTLGRE